MEINEDEFFCPECDHFECEPFCTYNKPKSEQLKEALGFIEKNMDIEYVHSTERVDELLELKSKAIEAIEKVIVLLEKNRVLGEEA